MTEIALIKSLLFLFMIAKTEGLKSRDHSVGEEITKIILESCHAENSFPNPVVIFGNFNKFIEGVSIIRINDFLNITDYEEYESLKFKASSVVLKEKEFISHLQLLRRTKLWNNMIPFFIIGENTARCKNSRIILREMWRIEILNSIYICPKSTDGTPKIYTLNPIADYAPFPWKRVYKRLHFNVFRQNFNANISCTNLTYDKTAFLNGYKIVAGDWNIPGSGFVPGRNYFKEYARRPTIASKAMQTIIRSLNASCKVEVEMGYNSIKKRYVEGSVDIMMQTYTHEWFPRFPYLFPFHKCKMVAVVKLRAEVSTLEKICQLWSTPVLIAAGFLLAILFLILMIMRRSFGSALLDVTRLLTYTSIQTDNGYQSFRIYFTTMLIFMVISNGVFQGKIAAFLTTGEKGSAPESINELIKLGYQMYTTQPSIPFAQAGCPRCEFKEVSTWRKCIELVLNNTKNVCVISTIEYESKYILLTLDRVRELLNPQLMSFKCRYDWPLRNRFNDMIMRIVEAGLPDYWEMKLTSIPKAKRQSMGAEWSSEQYRPVVIVKLDFAFELLTAGLFLAIIAFFLELCWSRYVDPQRLSKEMHPDA